MDRTEPEIYFGLGGNGLLIYMDEKGECFAEKVCKGSIHYIHGEYAHRLINTGDIDFKVGAAWRKAAGHDYEAIENKNFPCRVYKIEGKIIVK
jgi:glucose-6-phosphate isomerase, archaeal